MTWVNGRIAASVGTADSYVSFPILYLFIFRKTLVAKIRIIFSDQAHSSLKKRGFAKIQNNDEPSTPTGVELQVTAHDTMCGSKCLPNPRPQRRSNLSTDYMVRKLCHKFVSDTLPALRRMEVLIGCVALHILVHPPPRFLC